MGLRHAARVEWERIDWSQVSCAYGAATEVPQLLTRLGSPSAELRQEAIGDLWSSLCHQETVYNASAVAVPFLLQAAQEPLLSSSERLQLLALIACIGRGEDTCWDGYVPWQTVERCARAVEAVLPEIVAWADGGSPEARTWGAVLATYHPAAFRELGRDPRAWLTSASPAVATLVDDLVREVEPEPSRIKAAASLDEDTLDWLQQGLVDRSPASQARQVIWDLAEKDLL